MIDVLSPCVTFNDHEASTKSDANVRKNDVEIYDDRHRLGRLEERLGRRRVVREVRGRGLMIGIDLREEAGKYVAALTTKHRVLVLPGGATALRLLPPLVVEEAELEEGVEAIAEVLPS